MEEQKSKPNRKKKITIGATVIIVSLFITAPSYALSLDISGLFNEVLGGVTGYFDQIKSDTIASINEKWGGMKADAKKAVNDSVGKMNAPNPISAGDKIKAAIAKNKGSQKDTNIVQGAVMAEGEVERETTRASIESVLGAQGQERTSKEIAATKQTVEDAQTLANQAQGMDASQNILKVIAAQNAQVVSMLGQSRTDGLQQRHDAQQTNLMLSQIAEQGASERQRQNLAIDGIAAQRIELTGYTSLSTTKSTTP